MCLHRVPVIVIVKSWDGRGARFKYINVREDSTMVARLPQQVFLLLVLVTSTTTRTSYEPELSDWTTAVESQGTTTRSSRSTSIDEHDSPPESYDSRILLAARNAFGETSEGAGPADSTKTTDSKRLERVSSIPDIDSSSLSDERKNFEPADRNVDSAKKHKLENDWKAARKLEEHEDKWKTSTASSVDDSQFDHYSTLSDPRITRSISLSHLVSFASPSKEAKKEKEEEKEEDTWTSGSSERSLPGVKTRLSQSPGYPKATLGTWSTSDMTTTSSTKTHRLDQGPPKVDDQLRAKDSAKFEADVASVPANSAIITEAPKLAKFEVEESSRKLTKSDDELDSVAAEKVSSEDFPKDASFPDRIITRSIPDEFNTFKPPEKLKSHESPARGLGLTLAQEEAVEVSSWRFDVPPPESLYSPNDRQRSLNVIADQQIDLTGSGKNNRRQIDWLTSERMQLLGTTLPTKAVAFPKRYMREVPENILCERFQIGEPEKMEFYSPYYPQNYPPNANCVRILEAEKGMLLKLDFRDHFELEPMMPLNDKAGECRFDFLEVRDGQYGFSNLLGIFCDKNFPPEILSKSRYLWLRFHSDDTIEYQGFKAVWSTVPRPNTSGIAEELEPCILYRENLSELIVSSDDVKKEKKLAEQHGVPLDCLWVIQTGPTMKMQLSFDAFKLERPNDCGANFLDIFGEATDVPSRLKNFCGSIAESVTTKTNTLYIRLYLELKAINSSFTALITAMRERGTTDKPCRDNEYDCDDSTCIAASLKCNGRDNCRFQRDEDPSECGTTSDKLDSSRVIIILVIFSLIMFGMCSAFLFNCVRKLKRDHRIIREHIRQSRENRLDEIGRRATPCPVSVSRTDIRERGSESPSVEVDSSKELIPATTLIAHEYTKELVLEMKYGTKEINDIHQSNNVSNATQERLQESSEEPEMCDSSCQTRESLFDPKIPDAVLPSPEFSTFGYRSVSGSQNGVAPSHRGASQQSNNQQYRQHPHQTSRMGSQQSQVSQQSNSPPSRQPPVSERCSACLAPPSSREGSLPICPKHNPIPAPPGWSLHDPPYPQIIPATPIASDAPEYLTYQRYQSPKPDRDPILGTGCYQRHPQAGPGFVRQNTVGSGERYGSFIYGSERGSSNAPSNTTTVSNNTTGSGSQHSGTPKYNQADPRYRAEAVIEVDQKRPFSIESTKSAPDVIATH